MHVVIIGAGIGGLTLALMLKARRIPCEIFEASARIRELGVGINVLPHAIAELSELGLLERLDAVGVRTRELIYANRFGQEIWREPRGLEAGYEVPQLSIHRGRLQGVLRNAAVERLGRKAIHTAHQFQALIEGEGFVRARVDRCGSYNVQTGLAGQSDPFDRRQCARAGCARRSGVWFRHHREANRIARQG